MPPAEWDARTWHLTVHHVPLHMVQWGMRLTDSLEGCGMDPDLGRLLDELQDEAPATMLCLPPVPAPAQHLVHGLRASCAYHDFVNEDMHEATSSTSSTSPPH